MKTNNLKQIYVDVAGMIVLVNFHIYHNGRIGFRLMDKDTGDMLMLATVNISSHELVNNQVMIKSYGDNHGLYEALLKAKFIMPYNKRVPIGNNYALICNLNMDYKYKKNE